MDHLIINIPKDNKFTTNFFQQKIQILIPVDFEDRRQVDDIVNGSNFVSSFCKANKLEAIESNIKNMFELERPRVEDLLAMAKFYGYDLVEQKPNKVNPPEDINLNTGELYAAMLNVSKSSNELVTEHGIGFAVSTKQSVDDCFSVVKSAEDLENGYKLQIFSGSTNNQSLLEVKLNNLTLENFDIYMSILNTSQKYDKDILVIGSTEWERTPRGLGEVRILWGRNESGFYYSGSIKEFQETPSWKGPFKRFDQARTHQVSSVLLSRKYAEGRLGLDVLTKEIKVLDDQYMTLTLD